MNQVEDTDTRQHSLAATSPIDIDSYRGDVSYADDDEQYADTGEE
jgi:hypothetical protein